MLACLYESVWGTKLISRAWLQQLYAPLNYFGSYYRTIQRQLIDMENCFELLATNAGLTVSHPSYSM